MGWFSEVQLGEEVLQKHFETLTHQHQDVSNSYPGEEQACNPSVAQPLNLMTVFPSFHHKSIFSLLSGQLLNNPGPFTTSVNHR